MTKKCIISVLLVVAWALFASLFYKTIMLMLLFLVWKKHIFEMLPAWTQKWGMKPYWMLFFVERQTKGYEVSGYELRKRVRVFVNLCKKHYGKTPIIYCSQPFYTKNFLGQFNDCQYWCGDVNAPVVLPHAIHQKTIKKVAGIKGKVDYNIFKL